MQQEPNTNSPDILPQTKLPLSTQTSTIMPTVEKKVKPPSGWRSFLSTTFLIVGALVFALFLNQFVFQSYEVDGSSMEPTLQNKDRLIIWKLPRTWSRITSHGYTPARGDIIVFHKPDGSDEQLIKRVIAFAGERVVVKNGIMTVYNDEFPDGFRPDEQPYGADLAPTYGNVDVVVSDNTVFVSGDNRIPGASYDSRSSLGTIPLDKIVGSLAIRLYPFQNVRTF